MKDRDIFIAALQIDPAERPAYLEQACGTDDALRQHIEGLFVACEHAGSFLDSPPAAMAHTINQHGPEQPGTVIGPYKLLEQIGEGGMGLVFMAEQIRPVKRLVALKVLKPGMDTRHVIARFEAERQALALMEHPNIAKIHDAGATESGRPYFVMELVRGVPITEFCDQHQFTTRQRLELFVTVCQAVRHAHQKGIIHRDLKPSNVLVTLHDTVAVPKVIDFGIAKATTGPLTERTLFTHFAQLIGTPLYMSPEQAEMNGLDVDTRSDVYALGVMLYELLTGTTPFEKETLKKVGLDEMRRMIREEEPPSPSRRVSTLAAETSTTVCELRGVDDRRLHQVLRGDLDWIVMKALEKDRSRRYESASALAADVQRYLRDEAVEACPPAALYRLRKFARRNRRVLAMAAVITVALVAATGVSVWQAVVAWDAQHQAEGDRKQAETDRDRAKSAERQAKKEQDRAKAAERRAATEAAIAQAVNNFLQEDLLRQVDRDPMFRFELGGDTNLTVKEALDRAAAKIGTRFRDQPLVEAAIRMAIGEAYGSVGAWQLGVPHLKLALALRDARLGPDHSDTLASMGSLANAYSWAGHHAEAIALSKQILENRRNKLGPDDPEKLACLGALAKAHMMAGQWDMSVPLLEQLLEKKRSICGPTHPSTIATMHDLARNYRLVGRLTESMALHKQVLANLKITNVSDHEVAIWPMMTFAQVCQQAGKFDEAERVLREALEIARKRDATYDQRLQTANILGWLGRTLLLKEQYTAAEPLAREAVATFEKVEPDDQRRFYWVSLLGAVLSGQQKFAEAEPLLLQGYDGMKQREAILPANEILRLAETGERIVRFYEATDQPEKAREWRDKLKRQLPDGNVK